jgi:hypothetical protein
MLTILAISLLVVLSSRVLLAGLKFLDLTKRGAEQTSKKLIQSPFYRNAPSQQLTSSSGRNTLMSDAKLRFEDLIFETNEGGEMRTVRPAGIITIDEDGRPVVFYSHGSYGNVRDITFTVNSGAGDRTGKGMWKRWECLHPLLGMNDENLR